MYGLEYIILSIFILCFFASIYYTWKYVIKDKKNKFITRMKKKDDNFLSNKDTEDISLKDIIVGLLCNVAKDKNDDETTESEFGLNSLGVGTGVNGMGVSSSVNGIGSNSGSNSGKDWDKGWIKKEELDYDKIMKKEKIIIGANKV
jgi:hypothetical protein